MLNLKSSQIGAIMTKNDFFNLTKEQRKDLIYRASPYYYVGWDMEPEKIPKKYIREFIEMCNAERQLVEKHRFLEEVNIWQIEK